MPHGSQPASSLADVLEAGRADPAGFVERVLGSPLWSAQREVVRAVFRDGARVAWKGAPAAGKTYTSANLVIAFFLLHPGCKIITTAPSFTAVATNLWGQIRSVWERMPPGTGAELTETRLRGGPEWWAIGMSTDIEERFKGHHAADMLVVVDEAPGLRPSIYRAIEALRSGGNVRVLLLGNPTITSGEFYDAFTSKRESWHTITTGAFDTPNLEGVSLERLLAMTPDELAANPVPNITTRQWVRDQYLELGPDHPLWQANVLAEFPTEAENALIPLGWLEQARSREAVAADGDPLVAGVDVAEGGEDETVLVVRRGPVIVSMQWWKRAAQGEVVAALAQYRGSDMTVQYDSVGVGAYFATPLREAGFRCVPVNVGMAPYSRERYVNLKAELYWSLRERFARGDISGLRDERAIAQLASIQYDHDASGRTRIESKDAMRKRGLKSPDRAEAVMLAFAASRALQSASVRSQIAI
jgi:phage terminase large subunit